MSVSKQNIWAGTKATMLLVFCFLSAGSGVQAQPAFDSVLVSLLNQKIDSFVVAKNLDALQSLYADDFVFSHGTGLIEGKESWLKAVNSNHYIFRKHDSVSVELHPDMAVVRGKLTIQRVDKTKVAKYVLWYVRIYASRNKRCQLVSHITTREIDEILDENEN